MNITVIPQGRGLYAARVNGRLLCEYSRTPFLTSARILLGEGVPGETILTMKHEGSSTISLRARLDKAAEMTVVENAKEGPRFAPYRPFSEQPEATITQDLEGPRRVTPSGTQAAL